MFKPVFGVPFEGLREGSHTNIIMVNLKQIYKMVKPLDVLFNYDGTMLPIKQG
jgi:hypothetical protein